jgi:predicted RNA binding protein YcfA (HicA-like mRNA interferase family)
VVFLCEVIGGIRMSTHSDMIVVKTPGIDRQEFVFTVEPYTTLRDFVTSTEFLRVTTQNPNRLVFYVNGEGAADDLLLVSGDVVTFDFLSEKALITPRDTIKKLHRLVGLQFDRHGARHDHWRTRDGRRVDFPRHAGDLKPGTLKNIIQQAGLRMSINEFIAA